ncbi:hypothetical protein [Wolbachia endosymbiont (group A) of Sympetrum striolatum]|nr:hypothetical protein [Wolbachia endosymbiont (group A) of Sympetrum striolatum]
MTIVRVSSQRLYDVIPVPSTCILSKASNVLSLSIRWRREELCASS